MQKQHKEEALRTGCIGWFYGEAIPETIVYKKTIFIFECVDHRLLKMGSNQKPIDFEPFYINGDDFLAVPPALVMRNATKILVAQHKK